MKRGLYLYFKLIGVQLRSQLQFRLSFALDLLSSALIVALEFASLALVFDKFGSVQGWTLAEVAFLYGLAELSFVLMDMIFGGFDPHRFGLEVRKGTFDQILLRPMGATLQVLGSTLALRRLGKTALSLGILIYALNHTNILWSLDKLVYLPVVVISMVLFFGGLFIIGATFTFWTVDAIEVMNIVTYGGRTLISYPMSIYNVWMRHIFTFLVPAIFLNYYPALYFLDKPDPLGFPPFAFLLSPIVGLAMFMVALAFWGYGIRQYQSTGT